MLPVKRNMLLETVGLLFLIARDDVSLINLLTSESNEHTYGLWRMIRREFNVLQLIEIVQKSTLKLECFFQSDFNMNRSNKAKGYQGATDKFHRMIMKGSTTHGPVNVDLKKPAVDQLWGTIKPMISFSVSIMKPFLNKFGVEQGNGLSPLAVDVDSPRYVFFPSLLQLLHRLTNVLCIFQCTD